MKAPGLSWVGCVVVVLVVVMEVAVVLEAAGRVEEGLARHTRGE